VILSGGNIGHPIRRATGVVVCHGEAHQWLRRGAVEFN
jgi:hypothetical protein